MKKTLFSVLLLAFSLCGSPAMAQDSQRISQLSSIDRSFMSNQRSRIDDMARMRLGRQLNSSQDNNLAILQALLDRRLIRAGQTLELQAMGVVLGDELARELSLRWVIVEDRYGRSRALRFGTTDTFLFPITMISRRVEAGLDVSVRAVYEKAKNVITPLQRQMPFQ